MTGRSTITSEMNAPRRHHVVARFHLERFANEEGKVEVLDRASNQVRCEEPDAFGYVVDFNTVVGPDGEPDYWIERNLLAGLDSEASRAMRTLVATPPKLMSHLKKIKGNGWHPNHLLSPRSSVRFAMFLAAQAVRGIAFREAATQATGRVMQRQVREHYLAQITDETQPEKRAELEYMASLRLLVAGFDQNTLPTLAAQLIYHLGEVLYSQYFWAVHRFERPALMLGDDPLAIFNEGDLARSGSFAQVATAGDEPFSLWDKPQAVIARGVAAMQGNDSVMLALDPQHLLVLTRPDRLVLPGRYESSLVLALAYDLLVGRASNHWLCRLPGSDQAQKAA